MWNSGIMHLKKLEPAIKCPEEFIKVAAFTENALSVVYSTTATARPLTFTYTRSIDRVPWTQFPLRIPLPPSFFFFLFFFFFFNFFVSSHASVTHLSLFVFLFCFFLSPFFFPFLSFFSLSFLPLLIIILVFFPLCPVWKSWTSKKAAKDCEPVLGIWPPTWLRRLLYSLLECPDTGYFR